MNRLQRELLRLYGAPADPDLGPAADPPAGGLIDPKGPVRALTLELGRPADWAAVARVWNGVQTDLGLPAPAIAVSGSDAYQLWFSLAAPLPAAQAAAFLEALCLRYLGDMPRHRLALLPASHAGATASASQPRRVPAEQAGGGRWSAFVAPDLAPMFADEPWLDLPPNPDGQAGLLARLESMGLADFQRAQQGLGAALAPPAGPPDLPANAPAVPHTAPQLAAATATGDRAVTRPAANPAKPDPRSFLLGVMNDSTLDLALRIEAAKALLPYAEAHQKP